MSPQERTSTITFWILNGLLAVAFILEFAIPQFSSILDGSLFVLAAAASIAGLQRQLPLQNVLGAAAVSAVIGGMAHAASHYISLPFGPIAFSINAGAMLFNAEPWTLPFLWIVAIFNARGMARLILRPWRKVKNYGVWLMGLTAFLAILFDVALEPFATLARHFWHWERTKIPITWGGASVMNFIGWGAVALLIMLLVTPMLIRKQPGSSSAADIHPLIVWLGALTFFAVGCGHLGLWWPVGVDGAIAAVTAILAIRGLRW